MYEAEILLLYPGAHGDTLYIKNISNTGGGVLLSKEPLCTFDVNDVIQNNSYVRYLAVAYLGGRSLGQGPHLAYYKTFSCIFPLRSYLLTWVTRLGLPSARS